MGVNQGNQPFGPEMNCQDISAIGTDCTKRCKVLFITSKDMAKLVDLTYVGHSDLV